MRTVSQQVTIYDQLGQLLPVLQDEMVEVLSRFQREVRDGVDLDGYLQGYLFADSFIDRCR